MRGVAAWLVASPLHAVLALAATISLAWFSFLSGVVLVLLVLAKGVRAAALDALMAGVLMVIVGFIAGVPQATIVQGAVAIWLPAMLLGTVLATTRSLTLTLQLTVIIAAVVTAGFFLLVGDPVEFWRTVLGTIVEVWREMGLNEQADMLAAEMAAIASQMTMVAVLMSWSVHTVSLVLGYKLFRQLPDETAVFGRFRDLNFGRVIALSMAIASIAALVSDAVWLQNIAFVLFAVFWLQGLSIVHWLHGQGLLPTFGLIAVYVLMPFLNVILLMGLSTTGYIDAWFDFRRRRVALMK